MSELIYHYWKENPEYRPNKFDIVGGFTSDSAFNQYKSRIGSYYGGGEYAIDESELDNMTTDGIDIGHRIVAIGSGEPFPGPRSASTVEPGLWEIFGYIDPKHTLTRKKQKNIEKKENKKTRRLTPKIRCDVNLKSESLHAMNYPVLRFSDITDEILYSCPQFDNAGDGDITSILNATQSNQPESDYQIAKAINKLDLVGGNESECEESAEELSDLNDNIEEVAALEVSIIGSADDDTNIMSWLN